ncbi:hypothetical protein TWF694_011233 [Orbilia ellipsospora]|uniref:Uncharacterized protein n=1 Tax=Orbilia ellipsospora TaxID=2528407 RepID=A0AAV9XES4_9PEZI
MAKESKATITTTLPAIKPENVNVKLIKFPYNGKTVDPTSLIGLNFLSASAEYSYPLTLTVRRGRQKQFKYEIHSKCTGRFFNIQVSTNLKQQFSQATSAQPLKIIKAASGEKEVMYAAPMCHKICKMRKMAGMKMVDKFTLIGLQLQGMSEMGWIWAEDVEGSFEEGILKASVFIPTGPVYTDHTPITRATLVEDEDIATEPEDSEEMGITEEEFDRLMDENEIGKSVKAKAKRKEFESSEAESLDDWCIISHPANIRDWEIIENRRRTIP